MAMVFKKKINPLIQINTMKLKYPQFKSRRKGDNILFIGDLFIKPEFPIYKISVEYRGELTPLIKVISPTLVENPPHFYNSSNCLCLYHPNNFKWNAEKLISKEIMQWTIAWIYFYEVWLQTGKWFGPEAHHKL